VATIVWIGGLVILTVLVLPAARRTVADHAALLAFTSRLRRRFMPLTHLSLAVLILTGMFQMVGDPNYKGFLEFSNTWSIAMLLKHVSIIGMVGVGLILQFGTLPALERAAILLKRGKRDADEYEHLLRREARLTWVNTFLGMAVLAFTAWATAQ
jgi:uncharacterized membrane protein